MMRLAFVFALICGLSALAQSSRCLQGENCHLPDCFCPTFRHPFFEDIKDIPQVVYFGFDDALHAQVDRFYRQLFTKDRRNPNGCPISMSLYVQDRWTSYAMVNSYYGRGMEIGSHSVTHTDVTSRQKLLFEAGRQKDNLTRAAHIPRDQIVGWRSPNLKTAGDAQPDVLRSLGYTYDISLTYTRRTADDPTPWPYSLDFGYPYGCSVRPCPRATSRHPGFWEIPVPSLYDPRSGYPCAYVDSCRPSDEEAAVEYLWSNFEKVYHTNRAPFGLNMHAAWFFTPAYLRATTTFLQRLLQLPDVYIVTAAQLLQWMRTPIKVSEVSKLPGWGCPEATPIPTSHATTGHAPFTSQPTKSNHRPDSVNHAVTWYPSHLQHQNVTSSPSHHLIQATIRPPSITRHPSATYVPRVRTYQPSFRTHQPPYRTYTPPNTTSQPPYKTFRPPNRTYRPPTISFRPPSRTYRPPNRTQRPPTITYRPPSRTYRPPNRTYRPPTITYQPPSRTYRPPNRTYRPPTITYRPPNRTQRPPNRTYRPPTITYRPPSRTYRPPNRTYRPPTITHRPPSRTYRPPNRTQRPPTITYRPPNRTYRPPTITFRPPNRTYRPPTLTFRPPNRTYRPPSRTYRPPNRIYGPSNTYGPSSTYHLRTTTPEPPNRSYNPPNRTYRPPGPVFHLPLSFPTPEPPRLASARVPGSSLLQPSSGGRKDQYNASLNRVDSGSKDKWKADLQNSSAHNNVQPSPVLIQLHYRPIGPTQGSDKELSSPGNRSSRGPLADKEGPTLWWADKKDGDGACVQGATCSLPWCTCRSLVPPAKLRVENAPQMVYLTFTGSVNGLNYQRVLQLLTSRRNPNRCPISATFFVPLTGNYVPYIQSLRSRGHEIAMYGRDPYAFDHSRSLREQMRMELESFQSHGREFALDATAGPVNLGYRSPDGGSLGKEMMEGLHANKVVYDASLVTSRDATLNDVIPWPYTLDYGWQDCRLEATRCMSGWYPGLWEVPLVPLVDTMQRTVCTYADGCHPQPASAEEVSTFLMDNLQHALTTNRAPMGLHLRYEWFSDPRFYPSLRGLQTFLDAALTSRDDVFVLSVEKMLDWMSSPVGLDQAATFVPWKC